MKKQYLTILLAVMSFTAFSQTCLQKCVNESGGFRAINVLTNDTFDMSTHTIVWSQGTFPNAFTGQGTNTINWAVVSANAGTFTGSFIVTNQEGCSDTVQFCSDVFPLVIPTATNETYCFTSANSIALNQGTPAGGTYTDSNGNLVTDYTQAVGTQTFTYTTTGSAGCTGSVTFTITGNPTPNGVILGF